MLLVYESHAYICTFGLASLTNNQNGVFFFAVAELPKGSAAYSLQRNLNAGEESTKEFIRINSSHLIFKEIRLDFIVRIFPLLLFFLVICPYVEGFLISFCNVLKIDCRLTKGVPRTVPGL